MPRLSKDWYVMEFSAPFLGQLSSQRSVLWKASQQGRFGSFCWQPLSKNSIVLTAVCGLEDPLVTLTKKLSLCVLKHLLRICYIAPFYEDQKKEFF